MRIASLFGLLAFFSSASAMAEEAAAGASSGSGLLAVGAGLAVGLAALGGALGQGKVGGASMSGIARNPQSQAKMLVNFILALAFIESLVLLSWLIANGLVGKIH